MHNLEPTDKLVLLRAAAEPARQAPDLYEGLDVAAFDVSDAKASLRQLEQLTRRRLAPFFGRRADNAG